MPKLQRFIYRLVSRSGKRRFRYALLILALGLLALAYDLRLYRNMGTQEAMDAAQVARNLALGKGYTTSFLRPFSIYLLAKHRLPAQDAAAAPFTVAAGNMARQPDISNAPVYPVVLAGLMKLLPFQFIVPDRPSGFWSMNGLLVRYQPDFLITLFNQVLFFAVALLLFLLGLHLFDFKVAAMAALLLLGTELLWRFSASGLSTMLLLLIFMGLAWCLVLLEEQTRLPTGRMRRVLLFAGLAGLLVGAGALTRYAFGWLIIPVLLFVLAIAGRPRLWAALVTFAVFASALTPWVARNYSLCGEPFGTATYAVVETTGRYPQHQLERSIKPELRSAYAAGLSGKLITNLRSLASGGVSNLGSACVAAFFLAGLLLALSSRRARHLRYFALGCLGLLIFVQAMGHTELSEDSPGVNSENLLVLVLPLVLLYGASSFFTLLTNLNLKARELRIGAIGAFGVLGCLPLVLAFLPPRTSPVSYPPYFPPYIKAACAWTRPDELMMSDIPWAVAWYGQCQCVWLTLNYKADFFAINDYQKPVQALYLTPAYLDSRFLSQWARPGEKNWGEFVLNCLNERNRGQPGPPAGFPLQHWQLQRLWPDQFVLTFRQTKVKSDAE